MTAFVYNGNCKQILFATPARSRTETFRDDKRGACGLTSLRAKVVYSLSRLAIFWRYAPKVKSCFIFCSFFSYTLSLFRLSLVHALLGRVSSVRSFCTRTFSCSRYLFGRVPSAHSFCTRTLSCSHSLLGRVPTTPLHAEIYIFANHTNAFFLWARTFRAKAHKTKAV